MRIKRCKDCKGTGEGDYKDELCDTCGGSGKEEAPTEKFYGKLDYSG